MPVSPNTSYYHYYRSNGLVRSPGGYLGEDVDVLYDFIASGDTHGPRELRRDLEERHLRRPDGTGSRDAATTTTSGQARSAAVREEHQGGGAARARLQRLQRRARAQRAHLRRDEGARAAGVDLSAPGRPRRQSAGRHAEPLVQPLPIRRRQRRREGSAGVDRSGRGAQEPRAMAAAARRGASGTRRRDGADSVQPAGRGRGRGRGVAHAADAVRVVPGSGIGAGRVSSDGGRHRHRELVAQRARAAAPTSWSTTSR